MTKQEAYKEISQKLAQAKALIKECEKLSDESGEEFTFRVAYGMGGTYMPTNHIKKKALAKLTKEEKEALEIDESCDDRKGGWKSSSESC